MSIPTEELTEHAPSANGHAGEPTQEAQTAQLLAAHPQLVAAGVPPIVAPPMPAATSDRHSAGWWAGFIALALVVLAGAITGGFFIGQSTRMSDDEVKTELDDLAAADAADKADALSDQRASLQRAADRRARRVRREARAAGRKAGFKDGKKVGYTQGQSAGYASGQSAGYASGHSEGYSEGEEDGYTDGNADGFSEGMDLGSCLADSFWC